MHERNEAFRMICAAARDVKIEELYRGPFAEQLCLVGQRHLINGSGESIRETVIGELTKIVPSKAAQSRTSVVNGVIAERIKAPEAKNAAEPAPPIEKAPKAPALPPIENVPPWPDLNVKGKPAGTYRNARLAISELGVICRYDKFHDRKIVGGHAIGEWVGELSDGACAVLRQMIIDKYGFDPRKDNVNEAVIELCMENSFDPLLDYLNGLEHDGKGRLDKWMTRYLGADDTPLNRAIGKLALVAAVRRARKPGCQFDHVTTLEGPEGRLKSSAIRALAGEENFSDQTILAADDREQAERIRGVWIYEIADLAGMRRAEVEKVKAFITRTHDRVRPAYARHRIDVPRRCIFFGTTNEEEYLKSQTGNRRFWPVKTGTINIDALREDRDQLWAEAAAIEATGIPLVLPEELWKDAVAAQDKRLEQDPWDDTLSDIQGADYRDESGKSVEWVKAQQVLAHLGIPAERAKPDTYKRLKSVMRRLGWTNGRHYFGGDTQLRGYYRAPPDGMRS